MTAHEAPLQTITVTREAVCSADDQMNPLTLAVPLPDMAPLTALVDAVLAQHFLQFSSSHSTITGVASGVAIVRVHAGLFRKRAEFLVAPHTPVRECVPQGLIDFAWMRGGSRQGTTG
jgi:hypothetical protein